MINIKKFLRFYTYKPYLSMKMSMKIEKAMDTPDPPSEVAYLRKCLRICLFPDESPPVPPLNLDWNKFHALLIQNKLVGLFHELGQARPGLWPADLVEQLQMESSFLKLSGERRENQAREVLQALRQANVATLVLKGWALLPVLYEGEYSQRPTADIDILVRPGEADLGDHALKQLGYRDVDVEPWPGYFRRYMNSRHYQPPGTAAHSDQEFQVDIHWGLPDQPYYDPRTAIEPFFDRAQPVRIADVETCGLSMEDALLYACSHIMHHGGEMSIFKYYEVAAIILRAVQTLNWEAIISRAAALRVVIPLQRILSTVENLWPGVMAPGIVETLGQQKPSSFECWVDWWLVRIENKELTVGILAWFTTPGVFRRIGYILETLIPGPDYLKKYYGPAPWGLWPLLYPWRVGVILSRLFG
jgi:hypothetical protein